MPSSLRHRTSSPSLVSFSQGEQGLHPRKSSLYKQRTSSRHSHAGSETSSVFPSGNSSRRSGKKVRRREESPAKRWIDWMAQTGARELTLPLVFVAVGLIKWSVGLGGHSGSGSPPMFGDFEAQRHWMEITQHLNLREWYWYDLQYWGLDYPPLTAYHSYLVGLVGSLLNPSWFALDTSRGAESLGLKAFMRASVLIWEVFVYWSAVYAWIFWRRDSAGSRRTKQLHLLLFLLQPALILIDNGHFQFNSIMLGLTLWSLVLLREGADGLACVAFVGSLAFKQMSLYYAPAVGVWLIGKCWNLGKEDGTRLFIKLAIVTTSSFLMVFAPFLYPLSQLQQVLHRIFPFARGIFEDKVANFWCASNVVIKWRNLLPASTLPPLALLLTFGALLPTSLHFLYLSHTLPKATDVSRLLPVLVWEGAMAFFLFAFQVHEKSVLVPLLGVLMAVFGGDEVDMPKEDVNWGIFVNNVAVFSLWPLLKKDGLALQHFVVTFLWNYLAGSFTGGAYLRVPTSFLELVSSLTYPTIFLLYLAEFLLPPPSSKPDLYPVLNTLVSFLVFAVAWLAALRRQLETGWTLSAAARAGAKKRLQELERERERK